jgi:AraC family transcriptional regulator
MLETLGKSLDAHRVIRPDQIETVVPAEVLAKGAAKRSFQPHVSFRDYRSSRSGQALVPGVDSTVLIIYRDAMTRLRRRLDDGWKDEQIPGGNLAIIGGRRPTELEWDSHTKISHIYLPNELMVNTATALEQDYGELEIIDPLHFENQQLQVLGDMLIGELQSADGGVNLLVDCLASSLSVQLIRHYHRARKIPRIIRGDVRLSTAQRAQILDFIEANISRNFKLAELAKLVELSEVHFARCFAATFGVSPHQFVLKHRTQLAIELTLRTKLPFSEIADLTGFSDQAHLTRAVKSTTGLPPRVLRKS